MPVTWLQSALDAFTEDIVPLDLNPVRYDTFGVRQNARSGAVILPENRDRVESVHRLTGVVHEAVFGLYSPEELERAARYLLLRQATPVQPGQQFQYFSEWDLFNTHAIEIPEPVVNWGLDVQRGDALLYLADPQMLGILTRRGEETALMVFNSPAIVRLDPNAPHYPRPPQRPLQRPAYTQGSSNPAYRRARALLFKYLTREQKWELKAHRRFTVTGQDGRTYRIYAWSGGNVRLVEGADESEMFCVVAKPENPVPVPDLMLAHKLLLENNIEKFMSLAVRRSLRPRPEAPVLFVHT